MNTQYLIIGLVVIVAGAGLYFINANTSEAPVACTLEAKLCPDGSAVGRTGPNCEFEACPPAPTTTATTTVTLTLNQSQTVLGTTITAWAVTEDSRCASDVQCVWAGRVKVAFNIQSPSGFSTKELEPGHTVTTETLAITLTEVTPYPISTHKIGDAEYRFLLTITPHLTQ